MLGYVLAGGRGGADRLLAAVAARLSAEGWSVAGVVQINTENARADRACHMDLDVLPGPARIRISQDLGPLSQGCRLDPAGLEAAAGLVEAGLDTGPRLLVVNKFGKAEVEGRGFRPVIGRALALGIPVLTAVNPMNLEGFQSFAGGMGEALASSESAILNWCRSQG